MTDDTKISVKDFKWIASNMHTLVFQKWTSIVPHGPKSFFYIIEYSPESITYIYSYIMSSKQALNKEENRVLKFSCFAYFPRYRGKVYRSEQNQLHFKRFA